jgi:excisionase family DNA binding protein
MTTAPVSPMTASEADEVTVTIRRDVLRALIRNTVNGLAASAGRNGGGALLPGLGAELARLHAVAGDGEGSGRASETAPATMRGLEVHRWLAVGEAAELTGTSAQWVRRLAASGRLIAKRHGRRSWLIDADSARDYGKERKACR